MLFLWTVQPITYRIVSNITRMIHDPNLLFTLLLLLFFLHLDSSSTMNALLFLELSINEVQYFVAIIDTQEQLRLHTLLHSSNELSRLDEFPYRRLTLKPLRYVYFHCGGDLLDLF